MSAYTVTVVKTPSSSSGLTYSLVVRSAHLPSVCVHWEGYGSPAAARRSIPAAQILITAELAAQAATAGA